jgi:hypothetical protein
LIGCGVSAGPRRWAEHGRGIAEDVTVAEVEDWAVGLEKLLERIGPRFARSEPRARAGVYVRGLLSGAERKNGWTLAERAGDRTPDAMQRLLNHADWNPMRSAMTCVITSWNISGTRPRCWSLTRPGL